MKRPSRLPDLKLTLLLAGLLALAGLAPTAAAQYTLSAPRLYVGEPVTVTLPQAVQALEVTYRPNSSIATTETLTPAGGLTVEWTPTQAGVVRLSSAAAGGQNVSVRFQETPTSGLLVLILAGTILFGGAAFASVKLFQDDGDGRLAPF